MFLRPCEFRVVESGEVLETLVGSCVCVCIYNRTNGMAAMNHYLRARDEGKSGCSIGEYGSLSTVHIIKKLMSIDPNPAHYQAQVFGGAAVLKTADSKYAIGQHNLEVAFEVLAAYRIRITHKEIGGNRGRRVKFDTGTNTVTCRFAGDVGKKLRIENEE